MWFIETLNKFIVVQCNLHSKDVCDKVIDIFDWKFWSYIYAKLHNMHVTLLINFCVKFFFLLYVLWYLRAKLLSVRVKWSKLYTFFYKTLIEPVHLLFYIDLELWSPWITTWIKILKILLDLQIKPWVCSVTGMVGQYLGFNFLFNHFLIGPGLIWSIKCSVCHWIYKIALFWLINPAIKLSCDK